MLKIICFTSIKVYIYRHYSFVLRIDDNVLNYKNELYYNRQVLMTGLSLSLCDGCIWQIVKQIFERANNYYKTNTIKMCRQHKNMCIILIVNRLQYF